MFSWDTSFVQWVHIWRWIVSDLRVESVFNLESKERSKKTGRTKSGWRKMYQFLPNFWEFMFLDPWQKSGGKSLCFWKQNLGLYLYNSLHSPSHSVFLLQHHHSLEPLESEQGTWPQLPPACFCHTHPHPLPPKMEVSLEEGRNSALRGDNPSQSSPSKGPGTLLPKKSFPHHGDWEATVRPQKVSGGMFRRGEHFCWNIILATIISLLSEVIIIFYYCFRMPGFISEFMSEKSLSMQTII